MIYIYIIIYIYIFPQKTRLSAVTGMSTFRTEFFQFFKVFTGGPPLIFTDDL